jgi:hypothetical protein
LHWLDNLFLYMIIDQDIVFLVPDSCWAMVRNGNSISRLHRGHHQKQFKGCLIMLFLDNLAVILGSLTLQDKYNIHTLSENMKFICNRLRNRTEKLTERLAFLLVSNRSFNNVCILCMYQEDICFLITSIL